MVAAYFVNPTLHIPNCQKDFPASRSLVISHGVSRRVHPACHLENISYPPIFEIVDFKAEQFNFSPWDLGKMRTFERSTQSGFDIRNCLPLC